MSISRTAYPTLDIAHLTRDEAKAKAGITSDQFLITITNNTGGLLSDVSDINFVIINGANV